MSRAREEFIYDYFQVGLRQREILAILSSCHGIILSRRQLQRLLKRHQLYRRREFSDIADVSLFIQGQLNTSAKRLGYRLMHLNCLHAGLVVQKEVVRLLLKTLDSHGVESRRRHRLHRRQYISGGPNYIWHIDGYDKMKPFGICISACIDGFSRHIIWLEVSSTNNDPAVIAMYYTASVKQLGGIPARVRTDMGTENCYIANMQTEMGGVFLYGTSQHNQRIESWWGIMRRANVQFWLDIFHQLKEDNHFCGDFLDKSLIQFCFTALLKIDLSSFLALWDSHNIHQRQSATTIGGRPFLLYTTPQIFGFSDCLLPVDSDTIDACIEVCGNRSELPCDADVYEIGNILMYENNLNMPRDAYEALTLYHFLRNELITSLNL